MMTLDERKAAFAALGTAFEEVLAGKAQQPAAVALQELIPNYHLSNGWYTPEFIRHRLHQLAQGLQLASLTSWLSAYSFPEHLHTKTIGVILAGNLPLVGFDDFAAVLLSGARFCGKPSSDDQRLLPAVARVLVEIEPRFADRFVFAEGRFPAIDAIIATGSTNSSRYFEYYFGKYPHIIRSNRNGVAVLDGSETVDELRALADDIFLYFGLGCRSVTKLFVPEGYLFDPFYEAMIGYADVMTGHKKYMNNYEYHRTLYLLSSAKLLDNNFLLLKEDESLSSPPGLVHWESYTSREQLGERLTALAPHLQCVVGHATLWPGALPFGTAQNTTPADYADGIDTLAFLSRC